MTKKALNSIVCCACSTPARELKKPQISFSATDTSAEPVVMKVGNSYCAKCAAQLDANSLISQDVWAAVQSAMLSRNLTVNARETARLEWIE